MPPKHPDRRTLVKDIIIFQFKLVVDGLRDFILVPVSIVVGIVSLVKPGDRPGTGFYDLLRAGRSSEHWINLFGAANRVDGEAPIENPVADIDTLIQKVEDFAVNEYQRGELSRQAKEHVDQILNSIKSRGNRGTNRKE